MVFIKGNKYGELSNGFSGHHHTKRYKKYMRKIMIGKKYAKGFKNTEEMKLKKSISKMGDKNPNWLGDKVGYGGVHKWVKGLFKKPEVCSRCGEKNIKLDLSNISGKYKRDLTDWEWLCRSCHMKKDGRLKELYKNRKKWFEKRYNKKYKQKI